MMKKFAFLSVLVLSMMFVGAQNSKINSAITYKKPEYNQLDKAKEAIDQAIVHEKTMNSPKAWKVRGEVYQAIAQTQDEKFKALSSFPLDTAMASYKKALELDVKGTFKKDIDIHLKLLGILMINKGIEYFNVENFAGALKSFESSLEIDGIAEPGKVDSMIIFNAAIAADKGKNYDKAIEYYQKTADIRYEGSRVFGFMATVESERGDTAKYVEYLRAGIEAYPADNTALMVTLINHYLNNNESEYALEYLTKAIEKDPTNQTFYFAQGALYDKLKDFDNAKASYEKAIEVKSDYADAFYNLGALYFNKGADMLKEANNIPPKEQARYDAAIKEAFKELEKALPYLEKAHEYNPEEKSTVLTLKEIYFKLRNDNPDYMTKYNEYNEKAKAFE
jgi:tetratricopeptide (TPR) repeat protein